MRSPAPPLVAALVLGGALVACGTDSGATSAGRSTPTPASESPSASETPSEPSGPQPPECSEVWEAGTRLPTGYRGCAEDGEPVRTDRIRCSFGLVIVTYADTFYAVPGDTINESASLKDDPEFRRTVNSCQA